MLSFWKHGGKDFDQTGSDHAQVGWCEWWPMAAMMQGPKPEAAGSGVALGQLGQKPRQVMARCIDSAFF